MKKNKTPKNIESLFSDREKEGLSILYRLGQDCFKKKDYIIAIAYFNKYLEINPNNADIHNMIGYVYQKIAGKYENVESQIESFEKAIELNPNHKFALRNLALAYPLIGKTSEAVECFKKLLKLDFIIDDCMAYAFLQIQLKNFQEGWKYYENRFDKYKDSMHYPQIDKPKWQGQEILDKTLLIHFEQGYGDSICFCRYIEHVKPLVKKIIFRVQNELVDLFKLNINDVEIIGTSKPLNEIDFDYQVPLISLMYLLKAQVDNIPQTEGYIKADEKKVAVYKKEFFDNDCLKIGIAYNGAKGGNIRRDIALKYFYPLAKLKNVKIYSFQKGFGSEQLDNLPEGIEIVDLGKTFNDFSDTAAAMANIDVFVMSDSGVFNLAAAMGKKTFLLLNKYAEWRWFFDEKTTPWYDSVKLIKKQNENQSWDELIQRVIENL